jgi:hypothetical protein
MSEQDYPKSVYSSATMGLLIVIGTVVVVGGIFILALISGASSHGGDSQAEAVAPAAEQAASSTPASGH